MERRENDIATGTLLLVAGALLGAGIALLLAPQSGKQTRKDIARYAKKEVLHVVEDGQRKLEKHRAKLEKLIA